MAVEHEATLTLERRLRGGQAARWVRLRDAARELAAAGGYDAVTMGAVAERAGVSRATVYRYFASKDHLLAEVVVAWGREIAAELRARPPAGPAPARAAAAFAHALGHAVRAPELTRAAVATSLSADPAAHRAQAAFRGLVADYLSAALEGRGPARDPEREALMGHVFFSVLVQWTTGRMPPDEARRALATAAHALFAGDDAGEGDQS